MWHHKAQNTNSLSRNDNILCGGGVISSFMHLNLVRLAHFVIIVTETEMCSEEEEEEDFDYCCRPVSYRHLNEHY